MLQVASAQLVRFSIAVIAMSLAILLQPLIFPLLGTQTPFMLFFAAVIVSAWYGGVWQGLLATTLATVLCAYLYLPPHHSLLSHTPEQYIRLCAFAVEGIASSVLSAALYSARKSAREKELEIQKQQEILRQSESRLQAILENFPAALSLKDTQGRYILINQRYETSLKVTKEQVYNKTDYDIFPKEIADRLQAYDQEVLSTCTPLEFEETVADGDGMHAYLSLKFPICNSDGNPSAICRISRDISRRQMAEAALQKLTSELELRVEERTASLKDANLSLKQQIIERLQVEDWLRKDAERLAAIIATQQDIATTELDVLRVMQLIADRTQQLTGASGAAIALANSGDLVFRITSGSLADHLGLRLQVANSLAGVCYRTGEIRYCEDTETDPIVNKAVCRQTGIRSMIVVPLRYEKRIVGVLKVVSPEVKAFSDRDVRTLQLMVGFIAAATIHAAEFEARQAMIVEHSAALVALRQSEKRFKNAFEYSAVGMALMATDGRFLQVNQSLCDLLGCDRQELLSTNCQSVTHPDDIDGDLTLFSQMLVGEIDKSRVEKRYVHKHGHIIWTLHSVSLLRDSQGNPLHFICQIQDITDRKQAEEERAQLIREQTARAMAEAARQSAAFLAEASKVLASSLDYEITLKSVADLVVPYLADWCAIDIVDDDRAIRKLAVSHVDPAKAELAKALQQSNPPKMNQLLPVADVLRTGKSQLIPCISNSLLESATEDAEHLSIVRQLNPKAATIVPLVARGRTLGAITFIFAESDRCYALADLALAEELANRTALAVDNARLYRQAQEANRMKDEFLATLSHELRTPLNSMLGWSQLLRKRNFDQTILKRALETIERNAKSQMQLVEDILDVSRIVRGNLLLHVCPVELLPVIQAAIQAVLPAANAKAITIECAIDSSKGLVLGDVNRLQQIVWNLLSNAIKFTPSGGRVEIELEQVDSQIQIKVSDTGQGIAPDFLPYVFERFRQADGSMTRQQGGLGLGLAIVRHLVELHGGTVRAASPGLGQGATFTVSLPLMGKNQARDDRLATVDSLEHRVLDEQVDTRELQIPS